MPIPDEPLRLRIRPFVSSPTSALHGMVVVLVLNILLTLPVQAQKIYKCIGDDGSVSFSDMPCSQDQVEKVHRKAPAKTRSGKGHRYSGFAEIRDRFRCDTPEAGLAIFPSKRTLIAVTLDAYADRTALTAELYQFRKSVGLKFGETIPAGRSCAYAFDVSSPYGDGLTSMFSAQTAREGFLDFEQMRSMAEKLGYPVGPAGKHGNREIYRWEEKGLSCSVIIGDFGDLADSSSMKANCEEK